MSTALVCTGVQFPDSTIQTTAASSLVTITYENRGNLRTTTPSANLTSIAVEDLGIFTYYANNTEPDDDETCFVVSGSGGAWILLTPSYEYISNIQSAELELLLNRRMTGFTCFCQGISSMSSGTTQIAAAYMPGAMPGDVVIANPINYSSTSAGCALHSYMATIPCPNCVWLYITDQYYNAFYISVVCGSIVNTNLSSTPFCGANTVWKAASFRTPF